MPQKGILLVGYDVEKPTECAEFLGKIARVHQEFDAPCTLFAMGTCLIKEPRAFEEAAASRRIEMAQHTWSHILLKTIAIEQDGHVEVIRGASLNQIDDEIGRTNEALESICGVSCLGLTGPWAYYRGLADRPDILEIVHEHGIRYLRTYGRDEHDFQPVSQEIQPFWYEPQGFEDILECLIHGWQDVYLRSRVGWKNISAFSAEMEAALDYASRENLVFSWGSHDWSSLREDPGLRIIRGILTYARKLGMEIMSYGQYYARREAARRAQTKVAVNA